MFETLSKNKFVNAKAKQNKKIMPYANKKIPKKLFMAMVILSALVERFSVSRMSDFVITNCV